MKKLSLKSKILLSAILLGGGIAGAQTLVNMPMAADPIYNWKSETDPNNNLSNQSVANAIDHYGCELGNDPCATGTRVSGTGPNTVTLKFN
ncbi:hypothetical protein [Sphingobacterium mizutaii]|uniref:hypothetical protein n=1 Tax=Sphingobacterium mizutaii TaxID=1010 RepID=UPI001627B619|nr:hypothetical protein [Sphingobacterium mizutaii]